MLHFYNVDVKETNVYSRCQLCNSSEFLSVSKSEMNEMIYGSALNKEKTNKISNQSTKDWKNRTWQLSKKSITLRTPTVYLFQSNNLFFLFTFFFCLKRIFLFN